MILFRLKTTMEMPNKNNRKKN